MIKQKLSSIERNAERMVMRIWKERKVMPHLWKARVRERLMMHFICLLNIPWHGKHSQQPERRIGAFSVSLLGRRIPGFQIPELEPGWDPLIPHLVGSLAQAKVNFIQRL